MFAELAAPIVSLLNQLMGPLLLIVGALGSLYCVVLGVKYAKAEEPQEREKAKGALKGAVVGFLLIFVLILALNILMPNMIDWVNESINIDADYGKMLKSGLKAKELDDFILSSDKNVINFESKEIVLKKKVSKKKKIVRRK